MPSLFTVIELPSAYADRSSNRTFWLCRLLYPLQLTGQSHLLRPACRRVGNGHWSGLIDFHVDCLNRLFVACLVNRVVADLVNAFVVYRNRTAFRICRSVNRIERFGYTAFVSVAVNWTVTSSFDQPAGASETVTGAVLSIFTSIV